MIRSFLRIAVLFCIVAACGCSSPHSTNSPAQTDSAPPTTSPSMSKPVSKPPKQINAGRAPVEFDSCHSIDDATVSDLGFDPETRERGDYISDDYSFIGCHFDDDEVVNGSKVNVRAIWIYSTNITLDEFRTRESQRGNPVETLAIAGRPAIQFRGPTACTVAMQFGPGTFNIDSYTSAGRTDERPCDRVVEMSERLESVLPAE